MTSNLNTVHLDEVDWAGLGDKVCAILSSLKKDRKHLEKAAEARGTTLDGLMAAAITGMLREHLENNASR